ncbi:MAG TPA: M28 family peptidase, partial [Roseivirga sp.]
MKIFHTGITVLVLSMIVSCGSSGGNMKESSVEVNLKEAPKPNADSLLAFVQKQVDFGPRVPNTEPHQKAANWFVSKFESYGGNVTVQEFKDNVYDGTEVNLKNIIVSFNPSVKKRILLAAHWDTRPFGDKDAENDMIPIDGANDGASGVGVLLEVARVINSSTAPSVGVDMILFDGEDWGEHQVKSGGKNPRDFGKDSWYCLGSQYWSKNKHNPNYSAYYGILL